MYVCMYVRMYVCMYIYNTKEYLYEKYWHMKKSAQYRSKVERVGIEENTKFKIVVVATRRFTCLCDHQASSYRFSSDFALFY